MQFLKYQLLLVEDISPLELRISFFEITCFCHNTGGGNKSQPVTALIFFVEPASGEGNIVVTTSVRCM